MIRENIVVLQREQLHSVTRPKLGLPADLAHGLGQRARGDIIELTTGAPNCAAENFATQLLCNPSDPEALETAQATFSRLAREGNHLAMERLADCILHREPYDESAIRWLELAVEGGSRSAALNFGGRLVTGDGIPVDPCRGMRILSHAASVGSRRSAIKAGIYTLYGWETKMDRNAGLQWLAQGGIVTVDDFMIASMELYEWSVPGLCIFSANKRFSKEASVLLKEACGRGSLQAAKLLGYFVRRNEAAPIELPSAQSLLSAGVREGDAFALVNEALRLAATCEREANWEQADRIISSIVDAGSAMAWWNYRKNVGESEGCLVAAWLARHHKPTISSGEIEANWEHARKAGWPVPKWMSQGAR